MEKRSATLALVDQETQLISGHLVGSLVCEAPEGPLVDYPGNPHGPLVARSTLQLARTDAAPGSEVLLVFEGERSDRPIIVGLMRKPASVTPLREEHARPPAAVPAKPDGANESLEALVDGKRVVIDAQDEVILRCGKASITLRRNGRVVIRGTYVETRAEGVNRIKGGSVQIN
jgi:hypothetical protein